MTLIIDVSCSGASNTGRIKLKTGDTFLVGRSNTDSSLIADARLSRKHFSIHYADDHIEITHLSKTNPTLVASEGSSNFAKVRDVIVERNSCRIIAGSHRFILTVAQPATEIANPTADAAAFRPSDSVESVLIGDEQYDDVPVARPAPPPESDFWSDEVDAAPVVDLAQGKTQTDEGYDRLAFKIPPERDELLSNQPTAPSKAEEPTAQPAAEKPAPAGPPDASPAPFEPSEFADAPTRRVPQAPPAAHVFDDEDSKTTERSSDETIKHKGPQSQPDKIVFPIAEDFFDD